MLQNNPNGTSWRVSARARTWSPTHFGGQSVQDWSIAEASKTSSISGNGCAYQYAKNDMYAWTRNGWVSRRLCGRGTALTDLGTELAYYRNQTSSDSILDKINLTTSGETRTGSSIKINSINGYMETHVSMISYFSIKAWLPSSISDTTIDNNEILYSGKISLVNGNVLLEGGFVDDFTTLYSYNYNSSAEKGKINFNGGDLTISLTLPSGVSLNDVIIVGEDHAEYNTELGLRIATGITESKITDGVLQVKVFPNPTENNLTIEYQSVDASNTSVKIFDQQGKFITEVFQSYLNKDEKLILKENKSVNSLPSGHYYILINTDKSKYVMPFIKQ